MTYSVQNRQVAYALAENQLVGILRGFGWVDDGNDGCRVSSTDSATALEFSIDTGTIHVNAQPQEVTAQTTTVPPVDPSMAAGDVSGDAPLAQWVVFHLDGGGHFDFSTGPVMEPRPVPDPANTLDTFPTGRQVVEPLPPDFAGLEDTVVAAAYIQEGVTDSQAFDETYLYDFRMPIDLVSGVAGQVPHFEIDPGIQDLQDAGDPRIWYSGTGGGFRGFNPGTDSVVAFTSTDVVSAAGDTRAMIDTFRRGNLGPYHGDTDLMVAGNATAYDGEGWRLRYGGSGNAAIWSFQNDGLNSYFTPGQVCRHAMTVDTEDTVYRFWWAKRRQAGSNARRNHYIVELSAVDDTFRFIKSDDTDARQVIDSQLITGGVSLNQWYEIEVDRSGAAGTETADLLTKNPDGTYTVGGSVSNVSGDTTFDGYGIGFSGNGIWRADFCRTIVQ